MATQTPQPQTIGGVLDAAFELYRSTVTKTWPLSLWTAAAGAIPSAYLIYDEIAHPDATTKEPLEQFADPAYLLSFFLMLLIGTWLYAAIYVQQGSLARGVPMTGRAAFAVVLRRIPTLTLALTLAVLVVLVTLVTVVPAVILSLSLILFVPIVVFENRGAVQSLIGSHRLVWRHWWRTGTIVGVASFVTLTLYVAASVIADLTSLWFTSVEFNDELRTEVAGLVAGAVAGVIITPFLAAVVLCTYWDLKLRRDGTDLVARFEALSAA